MAAENGQAEVCLSLGEIGADANVTDKVSECQIWYLCVCVCVCVCMYVCMCVCVLSRVASVCLPS